MLLRYTDTSITGAPYKDQTYIAYYEYILGKPTPKAAAANPYDIAQQDFPAAGAAGVCTYETAKKAWEDAKGEYDTLYGSWWDIKYGNHQKYLLDMITRKYCTFWTWGEAKKMKQI